MSTTTTTTTDNTRKTNQAEPPALVLAVLNKEETIIDNMTIAGTKVDMYHIDDVLSGLYETNSGKRLENPLLMSFGRCALTDMTRYFVLHSIYLSLTTYTRKNTMCDFFAEHIKKETGMDIYLFYNKSGARVCHPYVRKIFQCFGGLAYSSDNHFNIYGEDCQANDAVKFRIWLRSELNAIAKRIEMIEPGLKALPGVLRLRIKEREARLNRKEEFECSMKETIPYIGNMAGNLYMYL